MCEETIIYIGGFELPDKNAAAHRVLSNAKIFRTLGKKVVFIGIDKSLAWDSDVLETKEYIQGFECYAVPYPKGNKEWLEYLIDIRNYLKICESLENIKMVIMYNFQAIAMKRLMTYCKKKCISCCADVTEWRSAKGEAILYRILKDSDTWYRMHILHKKMDRLFVISRYLENYYKKCKSVIYIPALTDASDKKWKNDFDKSQEKLKLVYAGNPGRKDRLDKLIVALHYVSRDYGLDVIGITEEQFLEYYPELKKMLNDKIVFHGRIPHLETLSYVKQANYSCFFREIDRVSQAGFPTKFAEAITCNTPVITNNTSNLSEYANGIINGCLLNSIETKEIANMLQNIENQMAVQRELFDYNSFLEKNLSEFNW